MLSLLQKRTLAPIKRRLVKNLESLGYELRRKHSHTAIPAGTPFSAPYQENPETGARNLRIKLERAANGGPFEWPNVVALNHTVVQLIGGAKRIVELGGGTGCFAYAAASAPDVTVVCSEFDQEASTWARENRGHPNIRYVSGPVSPEMGPFDLLVSIEVIEHIADYRGFLAACARLADRAIITTPNKYRTRKTASAMPPAYEHHVREWTAGEFYWVLKLFYKQVTLFAMPDPYTPGCVPITITDSKTPLIAVCEWPIL